MTRVASKRIHQLRSKEDEAPYWEMLASFCGMFDCEMDFLMTGIIKDGAKNGREINKNIHN